MEANTSTANSKDPAHWSVVTGVTPGTLMEHWQTQRDPVDVLAFYKARKGVPWREFSNWYQNKNHYFDFVLPLELLGISGVVLDQEKKLYAPIVRCENSEKAIMLCKAAVMGDATTYAAIAASVDPGDIKKLGRRVSPWNEERWQAVVVGVAVAVLRQKFAVRALRDILLSTGEKILCEATAGDKIWAIGVNLDMPKVYEVPARWKGSNILGWALMQVRALMREEEQAEQRATITTTLN